MSNYTMPTNITSVVDIWTYANSVTGDLYGVALLLGVFLVAFAGSKQFQIEKSFTASLFATVLVGFLLSTAGVVSASVLILPLILLAFSVLLL